MKQTNNLYLILVILQIEPLPRRPRLSLATSSSNGGKRKAWQLQQETKQPATGVQEQPEES